MNIGGTWDDAPITGEIERRAFAALSAAFAAGIRIFDHADIYTAGKSETVFGRWLRAHPDIRDQIVIQTKCGIVLGNPVIYDLSRDHIVESVESSLRRLGVERVDILMLHRPDPLVQPEEVATAFDELAASGKVGHFGVSNHSAAQMRLLSNTVDRPLVVNQLEVSLAHPDLLVAGTAVNQRDPEHALRAADTIEYCRDKGILLQAWSPLARGRYTGAEVNQTAELVLQLAEVYQVSVEAIVLAWITSHPAAILPVIGTTSPIRIAAAAEVDKVALRRREWYALVAAARGHEMP